MVEIGLRSLRPSHTSNRLGAAVACPVDVALLLAAQERTGRPLLCFRPPVAALSSVSAGVLRAARQRGACVGIVVALGEARGRALSGALSAVVAACEESGYQAPLALLAEGIPIRPDDRTGSAAHLAAMAVEAGFPNLVVPVDAADLPRAAAAIEQAVTVAREHELGWVLSVAGAPGREPLAGLLDALRQHGCSPAAVRVAAPVDQEPWPGPLQIPLVAILTGTENAAERQALGARGARMLEVAIQLPDGLRGPAAEARAYFTADALFGLWRLDRSATQLGTELLRRWRN
jgi:hypothetical protein